MSGSAPASPSALQAALTLPFFCSLCLSFLLICRSILVSPRVMRAACHSVRAPKANATELGTGNGQQVAHRSSFPAPTAVQGGWLIQSPVTNS